MAKYTIELNALVSRGYPLNLDHYPIFDEDYRKELNQKIVEHFWFREIGQETADRFNFFLGRKMNEIMPYYNQLYKSEMIKFNPIVTEYLHNQGFTDIDKVLNATRKNKTYADRWLENVLAANQDTKGTSDRHTQNAGTDDGTWDESETAHKTTDYDRVLHETELQTTDMTKKGDKTIDTTGTRTDNLDEATTENTTSKQTVTNDLKDTRQSSTTSNGSTSGEGWKDNIFSDLPQADFGVDYKFDREETAIDPEHHVWPTTYQIDGYATTDSVETSRNSGTSKSTETGNSSGTNTGTVKTDGTIDTNRDKKNTGTQDTVGKEVTDDTIKDTGTIDTDKNQTIHDTTQEDTTRNANGSHDNDTTFDETEGIITTGNTKTDETRNEKEGNKMRMDSTDKSREDSTTQYDNVTHGRSRWSPATLLQQFRETFLNIDMDIIGELENLFMGVY